MFLFSLFQVRVKDLFICGFNTRLQDDVCDFSFVEFGSLEARDYLLNISYYGWIGLDTLREDNLNPGSLLYSQSTAILRYTPGMPTTVIAGSVNDLGLVNGPASIARFSWIRDFVFYRPDRIAIADFNNHCIRDLDLTYLYVSSIAGICNRDYAMLHDFRDPTSIVYLRHQSYFIVSAVHHKTFESGLVTIDLPSGLVSSFNVWSIEGMNRLLLDESETVLYVGHWDGLAKVDLTSHQPAHLSNLMSFNFTNFPYIHYMVWLADGEIIAAVTNHRVTVIDLQLEEIYFLCSGEYPFSSPLPPSLPVSVLKRMALYVMDSFPQEFAMPHWKQMDIS